MELAPGSEVHERTCTHLMSFSGMTGKRVMASPVGSAKQRRRMVEGKFM